VASLRRQQPFSLLAPDDLNRWLGQAKLLKMRPGQQLLKANQLQNRIYLVTRGTVRFLAQLDEREVSQLLLGVVGYADDGGVSLDTNPFV